MFGINAGPEHLNGCPWSESPMWVKGLTGRRGCECSLIMVLAFLVRFIAEKQKERTDGPCCSTPCSLSAFIALNIASSSVDDPCGDALDLRILGWRATLSFPTSMGN